MISRERMIRTVQFQPVDRLPLVEWPIREATMNAWIEQGYPQGVNPQSFFSLDTFHVNVPILTYMYPDFEEEIIEKTAEYKIWRDHLGAVRKDFNKDATPGFVTRTWLEFPVSNHEDFQKIKNRYNSHETSRYPNNWKLQADILNKAAVSNHLCIPYLFWTVRDWMGFENLCLAFYDQPELLDEMFAFLTDMIIETLSRGIADIQIDMVELKEDMAYKGAPMISPDLFRKFMLPHYKRLCSYLKQNNVKFIYVDCDGYPGKLIPLWIEAGVDGVSPCEIAAGNDLIKLRKEYPDFVLFGGIDKRALTKGYQEIEDEVMRQVPQLINQGGYIPHIDHAIPPDIPLDNYLYYRKLMAAIVK